MLQTKQKQPSLVGDSNKERPLKVFQFFLPISVKMRYFYVDSAMNATSARLTETREENRSRKKMSTRKLGQKVNNA